MNKKTADGLVRAVALYQDHPNTTIHAYAAPVRGQEGVYEVITSAGQRYAEVPEVLPINDYPCGCDMPYCGNGRVSPVLLAKVRAGDPIGGS